MKENSLLIQMPFETKDVQVRINVIASKSTGNFNNKYMSFNKVPRSDAEARFLNPLFQRRKKKEQKVKQAIRAILLNNCYDMA